MTKSSSLYNIKVDFEINLKELLDRFKECNLFLTIREEDFYIRTKTILPKPNKEFGNDFSVIEIYNKELRKKFLKRYLFDIKEFNKLKEINVTHNIKIDEIILPKDTSNFEEVRKKALRKGEITRSIRINNDEYDNKKIKIKI